MIKINKPSGFSLLEVVIALIISNIALLGLAAGQLKSLQTATNSFNYTVSLIHATNAIEKMWDDICLLQADPNNFSQAYIDDLKPGGNYELVFVGAGVGAFNNAFTVKVSWVDQRVGTNAENEVALSAVYPTLAGCP